MDAGRRSNQEALRPRAAAVVAVVILALIGEPALAVTPSVAATPSRSAVAQPTLREIRLTGIDRSVLAGAPKPSAHVEGTVQAQSATVALRPAAAAEVRMADPANLVAVAADEPFESGTAIQVRVEEDGRWTAWTHLEVDSDHGPDPDSAEARSARFGSDPLMTDGASVAQVRIDTPTGELPEGTELSVVHAPKAATDPRGRVAAMAMTGAPAILTRAQWGADESWRGRAPLYTDGIKMGFVHHTASTSKYSRDETAAQLRAIYAYHTKSLGHSDIDYNFLVDRFGRLWEGRYGGMDRPVLGAHTAGFNEHTFGVSALGNLDRYSPSKSEMAAIRDSIARLFAWKLGMYGVNPSDTVKMVSAGYIKKTRYPRGAVANLPAISSHRMTSYTACPGRYLQAQMPAIRTLAAKYARPAFKAPVPSASQVTAGAGPLTVTSRTTRAVRWKAQFLSPCSGKSVRTYSGSIAKAGTIKFDWDLRDRSGSQVMPATYTIRLSGTEGNGSPVASVSAAVTVRPVSGRSWGPCANASRVVGGSPAATSVLWGRITAPQSRTVVLTGEASAGAAALAAGIAAAPLARSLGAPLLLTPTGKLAREVATDIAARRATHVIVVGGKGVVRSKVVEAVTALGARVSRLAGSSDAATAAAVARRMGSATKAVLV
ncbi:MAG: N-acetylmuramoyl-L-alanine amidase, partial [Candidatus Nanopelagicales bacterium]